MTRTPIRVLLVEDEPMYAELHRCMLEESGTTHFHLCQAQTVVEAQTWVEREPFEVILLDLALPDSQGLPTYLRAKALAPSVPIVVLTGTDDEQAALQAVRDGAQDYLVKGQVDGRMLSRILRYAIERNRSQEALRRSEEFFRLISENVRDLIAVIDADGRWRYNSPSYRDLLGEPEQLKRTDAFAQVHPADRAHCLSVFQQTLATGVGQRTEFRLCCRGNRVRHIEAQTSAIRDARGAPCQVVMVSRDMTQHKEDVAVLRSALSDLRESHQQLQAAQQQLIRSEQLEAVNTFAGGVAHEVRNPLQAIILGVDYLSSYVVSGDPTARTVLRDMGEAVERADGIIRGLLEFSAYKNRQPGDEDLNAILQRALPAVNHELVNGRVTLVLDLAESLPRLRLDARTLKHVFINLFLDSVRALPNGGALEVRTRTWRVAAGREHGLKLPPHYQPDETIVVAQVDGLPNATPSEGATPAADSAAAGKTVSGLGLSVLKKIIELYGGIVHHTPHPGGGSLVTILFKTNRKTSL